MAGFSREQARQLRDSLAPLDFSAGPPQSELFAAYCGHYGLEFSAAASSITHTMGAFRSGDYTIVGQYFAPPVAQQRGTAFLLHGYFDHSGIFGKLIRYCLQSGFAVVIADMPGHGLSSGKPASIASFRDYHTTWLELIKHAQSQNLQSPWVVMGQSTGGAIIIDWLLGAEPFAAAQFTHKILLAPLVRPRRWWRGRILFALTRWFRSETTRRFSQNSHDAEFLKFLRTQDQLQSGQLNRDWIMAMIDYIARFSVAPPSTECIQIIQGTGDGTVDWRHNMQKLQEKFPSATIHIIEHARHHLANEAPEYLNKVFARLDEVLEGIE